ncbi:MAG: FG-GAP-like repeat-containing protein, partial [Verrucomicrobiota bacterium]
VGDIDLDGLPEVIAVHETTGLIAFEHDGTFKWQSPFLISRNFLKGWGSSLADLDQDGMPEIILGSTVLNNDGTIRWEGRFIVGTGRGDNGAGPLSVVADLDIDGSPEVVAGKTAFRADGTVFWNAPIFDGYPGVANLDHDIFPEVVVVSRGDLYLLEHDGRIKWGPVTHPGFGPGGAPTIADVDGDGEAEIAVAGFNRFVVFERDGSIKWESPISTGSADLPMSSAFDFDGDGRDDLVLSDRPTLRIYRGVDGAVLFESPDLVGSGISVPVIADVDADGNAEIITTANRSFASKDGLHVYKSLSHRWVSERTIWNQHSYHITNVEGDGTIPSLEPNSWEAHNTYRLQRRDRGSPDLIPSLVRVNDLGAHAVITVRLGNGGASAVGPGIHVSLFDGDPLAGGLFLETGLTTNRLAPGEFEDVSATIPLIAGGIDDLWVYADFDRIVARGHIAECDESNNLYQPGTVIARKDLSIREVNVNGLIYDGQALTVSGTISAIVTNIAQEDVVTPFDVLYFEDLNTNLMFDAGVDNVLGSAAVAGPLPSGASVTVPAPIAGVVQFSENRIWAYVDSGDVVVEINEDNNLAVSAFGCDVAPMPGIFNPEVEWMKDSFNELPGSINSFTTPMVADLNDDGIPDIVYSTYRLQFGGAGFFETDLALRAVSGDGGAELWSHTSTVDQVYYPANIAIGDIDLDGRPEVLVARLGGELMAFEHDGVLKWISAEKVSAGLGAVSGPSIADLNQDGIPEIIVGWWVLDNNGVLLWDGVTSGGTGRGTSGFYSHDSSVADLDLDGSPEVVVGNSAFRADGELYWNSDTVDGLTAIGNFDADL